MNELISFCIQSHCNRIHDALVYLLHFQAKVRVQVQPMVLVQLILTLVVVLVQLILALVVVLAQLTPQSLPPQGTLQLQHKSSICIRLPCIQQFCLPIYLNHFLLVMAKPQLAIHLEQTYFPKVWVLLLAVQELFIPHYWLQFIFQYLQDLALLLPKAQLKTPQLDKSLQNLLTFIYIQLLYNPIFY